jgi:hypothetical protein
LFAGLAMNTHIAHSVELIQGRRVDQLKVSNIEASQKVFFT